MAGALKYDKIIKYQATATCREPLHIGSAVGTGEEVLVHPTDEMPFIQATSIAGVFRDYFTRARGVGEAVRLFGTDKFHSSGEVSGPEEDSVGRVAGNGVAAAGNLEIAGVAVRNSEAAETAVQNRAAENGAENPAAAEEGRSGSRVRFTEGTFLTEEQGLRMELRPRLAINRATGTCDDSNIKGTDRRSGHKFNMEYVGAGAGFRFCVYLYDEQYREDMEDIFAALNSENIQFGGQKSNGCGYVKIDRLQRAVFDMRKAEDRRKWAGEEELSDGDYEDITAGLPRKSGCRRAYEITVAGRTEGELLVKGIAVMGSEEKEKAPNAVNIRNARGEFIIPGSSLKGAVRSQMEKIAAYMGCEKVIYDTFGRKSEDGTKGSTGNISFFDTVVGKAADNEKSAVRYRIHIDKFTGGVMEGPLFAEKNVSGELKLHIVISGKNSPDKSCGLLLLALRDLAIGAMSLGSGYNIGKGILEVDTITVTDKDGRQAVIDCRQKETADDSRLIPELLGTLRS